jgi:hypothetical protein
MTRPVQRLRNSNRFCERANNALNIRCISRLSRLISIMNATVGLIAAMYEKLWSGPTPM